MGTVLEDRRFALLLDQVVVARARSVGGEMFWESLRLEAPEPGAPLPAVVCDDALWNACRFELRHERTGAVLRDFFSAGGKGPWLDPGGRYGLVSVRGTGGFAPPPPDARPEAWLLRRMREFLAWTARAWGVIRRER